MKRRELHHLSDASTTGYGQCTYLRLINDNNMVHCSLVMAKARVTPLRIVTIPRLELQAAVISVKISSLLKRELPYEDIAKFFWTDSRVILGYIGNDARRFHVYVANRVQQIREITEPSQWHYVKSEDNPADHASRGLPASELSASNWFSGPSFLWESQLPCEDVRHGEPPADDPEVRRVLACTTNAHEEHSLCIRSPTKSIRSPTTRALLRLDKSHHRGSNVAEILVSTTSQHE